MNSHSRPKRSCWASIGPICITSRATLYQLIAPLFDPLVTPEEKRAWRQWVLGRTHQRADGAGRQVSERTLRRWVEAYRTKGWEGMQPATRRDKGQLRAFAPAILEQACQLNEEDPSRGEGSTHLRQGRGSPRPSPRGHLPEMYQGRPPRPPTSHHLAV